MKLHPLILACSLIAIAPLPALAGFIPPSNLPAGSQYEVIFVTSAGTPATDPYIGDYNAFVTAQAAQDPSLPQGVTWRAIASTIGDINTGLGQAQANENAPFTPSIPVYNTAGQLVADAAVPLYGGSLIDPITYDQYGTAGINVAWTGSNIDGTADHPLGGEQYYGAPDIGASTITTGQWIHDGINPEATAFSLYALSSPITVVPEPGTLALLAAAAAALAACHWGGSRKRLRSSPSRV